MLFDVDAIRSYSTVYTMLDIRVKNGGGEQCNALPLQARDAGGRYAIAGGCIAIVVFAGFQMRELKIGDPTPGSPLLWPDHTYNRDQSLVDGLFDASSENFMLFYEGSEQSVYAPEVLIPSKPLIGT